MDSKPPTVKINQSADGHAVFTGLSDALIELYPEEAAALVVVADAEMNARNIIFSGDAQINWHNILVAAIQQDRLALLLHVVCTVYDDNQALKAAYAQYQDFIDQGGYIGLLTPVPTDDTVQLIQAGGGTYVAGSVNTGGGDFIGRDKITMIVNGQRIELPTRADLMAYVRQVQARYARWADQPDERDLPLFQPGVNPEDGPDAYIATHARALPMRVAEFRLQPGDAEPPAQELVAALGDATRIIILGGPGSGKTTALERLAWVTATATLSAQALGADESELLVVPLFARLADYRGEPDLLTLLRRALNRSDALTLDDDLTLRQLLRVKNVRFVLLLDGLNEFACDDQQAGMAALRGHLDDYPRHMVHVTCRTADFDPATQQLPNAQVWTVQLLVDTIGYWDDPRGQSDVRDYLCWHLGTDGGKRLWERLHADERLRDLARLPLFLYMFKEVAGDSHGELPADHGMLLRKFVRSAHILGRILKPLDSRAERSLEGVGWWLQTQGRLELEIDDLYAQLDAARGPLRYEADAMRQQLQDVGLLIDLGDGRYRLLHQLVQEYAAAAYLARQSDCATRLPELAQTEWWRECAILTLWLRRDLHTPAYLQQLMATPAVDLRVCIATANILAQVGDPRFTRQSTQIIVPRPDGQPVEKPVDVIEPLMVTIPMGEAILGGEDPDAYDDELPQCTVPVAAFELAVYPVTNVEYQCFIDAGGYDDETLWTPVGREWLRGEGKLDAGTEELLCKEHQQIRGDVEQFIANRKRSEFISDEIADAYRTIATWTEDQYVELYSKQRLSEQRREPYYWRNSSFNQANQPVVGVNWYEVMAYASWLAHVTGKAYRLPTEAEWEWAARRQTSQNPGRRYPWGDDWDAARCNSGESRLGQPSPVGVYPRGVTPDGLHDLAGNVYEWTLSLYRPYPYRADDGREDPLADGLRVMRGGSWHTRADMVRCAFRHWHDPWNWHPTPGFRLAKPLP